MANYRPSRELQVVKPCSESWEGMVGNSRVRHCESCGRDVLNVAAMTARQVEAVIAEGQRTGTTSCMRIVREGDGLLMVSHEVQRPALLTRMAAALSLTVATVAASAQAGTPPAMQSAVLRGRVIDPTGAPIPGVDIELRHDKKVFAAKTDASGFFAVSGVAGDYEVVAAKAGFSADDVGRVHLGQGVRELKKSIQLNVWMVEVGEVVSVPLDTRKAKK